VHIKLSFGKSFCLHLVPSFGRNELEKKNRFPSAASLEKPVKTEDIPRPSDVGPGIYNTLKTPPHIHVFADLLFRKKSHGSALPKSALSPENKNI
jgi:hypothetical protein